MMYARLMLARGLLTDDGVVFISIDDYEVEDLKIICNEVFGEENCIETLVWKRRATPPNDRVIGCNHEPCELWERYLTELFRILGPLEFASLQPFV